MSWVIKLVLCIWLGINRSNKLIHSFQVGLARCSQNDSKQLVWMNVGMKLIRMNLVMKLFFAYGWAYTNTSIWLITFIWVRSGTPGFPKVLLNIESSTCKGLIEKIRAAFDKKGQKSTCLRKRAPKLSPTPIQFLCFTSNKFLYIFCKSGQHSIDGSIKDLD